MNGNNGQYARKCIKLVLKVNLDINIAIGLLFEIVQDRISDNEMKAWGSECPTRNFSVENKLFNPTKTLTNKNL